MALLRFQVFVSMQTGNLITAGISFTTGNYYAMILPVVCVFANMLGAAFFDGLELAKVKDPMLVSTVVCFACYITTAFVDYFSTASSYQVIPVCLALGIQNAWSKPTSPIGVITVMMTGNIGKIAGFATKRVLLGPLNDADVKILILMSAVVVGFMIGIVVGALCLRGAVGPQNIQSGQVSVSEAAESNLLWWVFLPPGILQFVCLVAWRIGHDAKAHAEALRMAAIEAVNAHNITAKELNAESGSFTVKNSMYDFQVPSAETGLEMTRVAATGGSGGRGRSAFSPNAEADEMKWARIRTDK
jgi:uncharacterized membrane protein YoaK (UPF0700 family)